jgi:S1-C subfamily serine protease
VLVWIAGATVLLLPGQTALRREVQRSAIVRRLNDHVPPRRLLHLLARIDPIPAIVGPRAPAQPPPVGIAGDRDIRRAAASVVRVLGTACGIGIEGSGWFVSAAKIATAAHVVAGEQDTHVQIPGRAGSFAADVVAFDPANDVAILRVHGVVPAPLRMRRNAQRGRAVAIVGYPENGPLTATPGRVGDTSTVLTRDAYGHGPVRRTITAVAGRVRHGDSGGPAIDSAGRVQTMLFAARIGAPSGYGVPTSLVARAVRAAHGPVSTGACAAG